MKYLITYASRMQGKNWELTMDMTSLKPVEWLASVQKYPETYVLINSQEITDEEFEKYNGEFKGT